MKTVKLTLGIFVVLAFLGLNEAMGQWAFNGTHIYNTNADNVGIGTTAPAFKLDVVRNGNAQVRVFNNGGGAGATYRMTDQASGADFAFKSTATGGFKIRDITNAMDVLFIESNSAPNSLYINASGWVGMGTATPVAPLNVMGDQELTGSYPFYTMDNTTAGGNCGLEFSQNGSWVGWIFYDNSDNLLRFNCSSSNGYSNHMVILPDGRIGINTQTPATGYQLSVNGKVACEEVLVELDGSWPDYVFAENYNLMSLTDLENSIKQNNHLPGLPSASTVEENGFELADMQKRVVEKLEELTLYTIEQGKQIQQMQEKIADLEKENKSLKSKRQK